jgi:hypothetical protein
MLYISTLSLSDALCRKENVMMKLTETQRNFRKQMKNMPPSHEPYERLRDGNPFLIEEKGKSKFVTFLSIILLVIIFTAYKNWPLLQSIATEKASVKMEPTSLVTQPALPSSKNLNTALPSSEANYLKTLGSFMNTLITPWQQVSDQNKIPWEQRNIEQYRAALLNGITACDQTLLELDKIQNNEKFGELKNIVKEYHTYSKLSFKAYLDYTYSKNPSDLALGNKYIILVNQTSSNFNSTLVKLLKQNGYSYQDNGKGQIRYSVRP